MSEHDQQQPVENWSRAAEELLGPRDLQFSYWYREHFPGHVVLRDARVFNEDREIIWTGDLDLSSKIAQIKQLAETVGPILVTPESYFQVGLPEWLDFITAGVEDDNASVLELGWLFPFRPDRLDEDQERVEAKALQLAEAW